LKINAEVVVTAWYTNNILRAVKEFGNESIARVFLIDIAATPNYLSFLLRKYKGNHYGVRYPNFIRPKQNLI
jgi:hypothetical protein